MSATKQSVGNLPAFPIAVNNAAPHPGMTYRQWLIGQIAGAHKGMQAIPNHAEEVILIADAILLKLDREAAFPIK